MADSQDQVEPCALKCLNNDVISKVLTSLCGEVKGRINVISIVRACSKSEGLTSDVFRVNVIDEGSGPEIVSFILKLNLKRITQNNFAKSIFLNESLFFSEVSVEMYRVLTSVGNFISFSPKCYYSKLEEFIVLEDLLRTGYQMASKGKGLDLEHSLLVMQRIALFHATAVAVAETQRQVFDRFNTSKLLSTETLTSLSPVLEECFEFAISEAKVCPELKDGIHGTMVHLIDTVVEVSKVKLDCFSVLLHGDLWINNMIFKYTKERVESVKFIDFQMIYLSSPAVDLTFFLYTSVADEVIIEHLDSLILEYHKNLQNMLSLLNYGGVSYSLSDLKRDMDEKISLALLLTMSVLPIALSCSEDNYDLESVLNKTKKSFSKPLYNPQYIAALRRRFPLFKHVLQI